MLIHGDSWQGEIGEMKKNGVFCGGKYGIFLVEFFVFLRNLRLFLPINVKKTIVK